MPRTDADSPGFEAGAAVPVVAYILVVAVLSALLFAVPGQSPPLLGMAWGVFLAALAVGAVSFEGVSPRSILPSVRTLVPVVTVLVAFWGLYNLVAYGLALGGVSGFEATSSSVAVHPVPYLAALFSSLLFTAIPEELFFRAYLQQKAVAVAGGVTRRAVVTGVAVVAVLFALFHLPRWFLASGHGGGTALVGRLFGLTLVGLTYGAVYALTGNVWLVALFHATMNYPPFLLAVNVPTEIHFVVAVVEYAGILSVVHLSGRLTDGAGWLSLDPT